MKRRLLAAIDLYRSLPNRPRCPRTGPSCSVRARRHVSRYGVLVGGLLAYRAISACKCWPEEGPHREWTCG